MGMAKHLIVPIMFIIALAVLIVLAPLQIGCTDVRRNLLDSLLVALLLSGTFVTVMEMVR